MAKVLNKELVAIGQRVVIETVEGNYKATVFGYPFKTKNFISVIYDGDEKQKPVPIDLTQFGNSVNTTRGRRPAESKEIPGATLSADHLASHKAPTAAKAAPVAAAPTRSRKAAEVAAAPVHQPRAKRPSELARAAAKAGTPVAAAAAPKENKLAGSGSTMLMKVGGKLAYALAKNPTEAGLAELLTTIESGLKAELGIGQRVRKAREVAAAPAPVAAAPSRRRAAPAPTPAPVPVAAKPAARAAKPAPVAAAPTLRAPTIGRRPNPMA